VAEAVGCYCITTRPHYARLFSEHLGSWNDAATNYFVGEPSPVSFYAEQMTYPTTCIAARSIAIFLVSWALSDIIAIPRFCLIAVHSYREVYGSLLPQQTSGYRALHIYYLRDAILLLAEYVLRTALFSAGALWFARCGPGVQRLFTIGGAVDAMTEAQSATTEG
jgi:hypothetical protein